MAYRLERRETVSEAVTRLVADALDDARVEATDARAPLDERVHAVRSHVKRARAALRLARGHRTRSLDRKLRALGRTLSDARDDAVARDLWRALSREVRRRRHRPLSTSAAVAGRDLEAAVRALERLRRRLGRWPFEGVGRSARQALARSLRRTRRFGARRALEDTGAHLHHRRRVVKRLSLQLRLFRRIVPEVGRAMEEPVSRLSDLLGEIHDLAVLRARVARERPTAGAVLRHLDARQRDVRAEALALGVRALAPRPRLLETWLRDGWRTWRSGAADGKARRRTRARASGTDA